MPEHWLATTCLIAFIAMLLERAIGYPSRVYNRIGHPVSWIGHLITFLDRNLNHSAHSITLRRLNGGFTLLILVCASGAIGFAIQHIIFAASSSIGAGFAPTLIITSLATAIVASSLLAQRSLGQHVVAVADALEQHGLAAGRHAVSMIVGRDPDALDEAAVCRAAIESLAENFSDGVTAPAFWLAIGGLPGAAIYKAVNTADSMIGHRTARHEAFGAASARFDDLINLPASRLTALALVAAASLTPGADAAAAWRAVWRDAGKHRSPNAGWPEAAMAGALGLALAGPRIYGGQLVDDAAMGAGGRRDATAADIRRALRLYTLADALLIGLAGVTCVLLQLLIGLF